MRTRDGVRTPSGAKRPLRSTPPHLDSLLSHRGRRHARGASGHGPVDGTRSDPAMANAPAPLPARPYVPYVSRPSRRPQRDLDAWQETDPSQCSLRADGQSGAEIAQARARFVKEHWPRALVPLCASRSPVGPSNACAVRGLGLEPVPTDHRPCRARCPPSPRGPAAGQDLSPDHRPPARAQGPCALGADWQRQEHRVGET